MTALKNPHQILACTRIQPMEKTMMDDVRDIASYYNNDPEKEHMRLERHQLEVDMTWRFLDRSLPAQGSVLEIGAATGRYTLELARRGYTVTAVDLSAALLDMCERRIIEAGFAQRVQFVLTDARDLSLVETNDFDVVLMMGPLYHLFAEADRKLALAQAHARMRQGGLLFSSFISRLGIFGDIMQNVPDWIEKQDEVRSLLAHGKDPGSGPQTGFRGYFARVEEIAPLHESVGFETIALVGVEPGISADDDSYNQMQGRRRQLRLDLLYEISAEASIIGASRHLLYIGKKE
jgi:SAM-dependent methyltransferase